MDAQTLLTDFLLETGIDLSLDNQNVETIGGVVSALAEGIPEEGTVLEHPKVHDVRITVKKSTPRSVKNLLINITK